MIACLSVPYFAAGIERRDNTAEVEAKSAPGLVIGGQPWEPQPLFAFSREAAKKGVKPGMSLRLAHVLSPEASFIPATPPRYLNASGEITDILTDFTHLVESEDLWARTPSKAPVAFQRSLPARYTLDLESLPAAEALSLTKEIGRTVRGHTHLAPAIGLAKNKFTAQVAAATTRPNHALPVAPGEEAAFLASRTSQFLPLDKETARRLSLLGIHTLGQLASLPLASLQEQFGLQTIQGQAFIHYYHLAQGQAAQEAMLGNERGNPLLAIRPLSTEKQEQITHHFDAPIANILVLKRVLAHMATELAGRLQAVGLEGRTLHLAWETENSHRKGRARAPYLKLSHRHPTADPQKLTDSLYELLYQAFLGETAAGRSTSEEDGLSSHQGIVSLTVTLTDLEPVSTIQQSLFAVSQIRGPQSGMTKMTGRIQEVLTNIIARHGGDRFYRPILTNTNHPLPERRFQLQEMAPA